MKRNKDGAEASRGTQGKRGQGWPGEGEKKSYMIRFLKEQGPFTKELIQKLQDTPVPSPALPHPKARHPGFLS